MPENINMYDNGTFVSDMPKSFLKHVHSAYQLSSKSRGLMFALRLHLLSDCLSANIECIDCTKSLLVNCVISTKTSVTGYQMPIKSTSVTSCNNHKFWAAFKLTCDKIFC